MTTTPPARSGSAGPVTLLRGVTSHRERHDWALQGLGQIDPAAMHELREQLDAADRAALDALRRRNLQDTHNEPTNLIKLQFLERPSLRVAHLSLDPPANSGSP